MSLRFKIALGVLAATVILAAALLVLGFEAKDKLDEAAQRQRALSEQKAAEISREQHRLAVKAIEDLVISWVSKQEATHTLTEIGPALRDPENGFSEAAIVSLQPDGSLEMQVSKPPGSQAQLSAEEEVYVREVLKTREYRLERDVLYYPFRTWRGDEEVVRNVLRLQLEIPPLTRVDLPEPESIDLGPMAWAAFTTLGFAMLAVFVLLMFALRKFVLSPLGDVLQDSRKIVKGVGGLEIKGMEGQGDIETMVAAFNAMFKELKAYQTDLEGKVKSATRTIRQQQQSLIVAQRLAATGTLAAGLAHEINNPLSGMLNAARLLRKREGLDSRAHDYIDLMEEGLQRIEMLMKQILDFSRRRDMKPERFAPESALQRALPHVTLRLKKRDQRLEEDISGDLPEVYGNLEEIGQVLINLLFNASDASPDGSTVRVSFRRDDAEGVVIRVEDSGPGVPDKIKQRIFDPFFTTKEPGKGTGLGLAIAHTIIDNHGGSLRVERSAKLEGAAFIIELPPAEKHESARAAIAASEKA